jgi:enamine deaminase RidA (YjgF/YER057c/UK114 family)
MHSPLSPATIHPPFSAYSNGVEVPAGQRLVFCSGQLGIARDGTVPATTAAQADLCFDNLAAILAESGLALEHVVRINAYVSGREHLKPYMDVRNRRFSAPLPASTLVVVSGFARSEFFVEVEVIAAGPASEV